MIIVICVKEEGKLIVSHGINEQTMRDVILPQVHPRDLGASFSHEMGEWVINED